MFVLFDVEWNTAADDLRTPTQIAALRTDAAWQPRGQFQSLVRPEKPSLCHWNFMAYNGYSPEEFQAGPTEAACFLQFFQWLAPDDILCCWHEENAKTLALLYDRWLGGSLPWRCHAVNDPAYILLAQRGIKTSGGLYSIARRCSVPLPSPEHCSCNDVSVLQGLLNALQFPVSRLTAPHAPKVTAQPQSPGLTRRQLTAQKIAQTPYNYIYLPHSPVFHRRDCKLVLNSKQFLGSVRYHTAAKKRRPCKVCNPIPEYSTEQAFARQEEIRQRAIQNAEKLRLLRKGNEVIHVRLLGNQPIDIHRKLLVGCCHSRLHPGRLTQKLMEQHDCLRKNCRYFEKYEEASYWRLQAEKAAARQEAKAQKQLKKARETDSSSMLELFQSYAEATGSALQLVRVQEEKPQVFKLFYVSENPFRDGNHFPDFLNLLHEKHPRFRILLRHIQDLQGHFVTIEEYAKIKR